MEKEKVGGQPDDEEVCFRRLVLVDRRSVEVVLDGLDALARGHLTQEGAGVGHGDLAELVFRRRGVAARLPLEVVFDLKKEQGCEPSLSNLPRHQESF